MQAINPSSHELFLHPINFFNGNHDFYYMCIIHPAGRNTGKRRSGGLGGMDLS